MTDTADKIAALRLALNTGAIPDRDLDFCASIVGAAERGRASEKQLHWVGVLYDRHCAPKAPVPTVDLSRLFALLREARSHGLKRAFMLATGGPFSPMRLSLSKDGEAVYVKAQESALYLGAVRDGRFLASREAMLDAEAKAGVIDALSAFAADPVGQAALYGHQTGHCCFCARELTDKRSVAVGYGPICAEHFGLPWGEQAPTLKLDYELQWWEEAEAAAAATVAPKAKVDPCGTHRKGDGSYWAHDRAGIPLTRVCSRCADHKLARYDQRVLRGGSMAYDGTEESLNIDR